MQGVLLAKQPLSNVALIKKGLRPFKFVSHETL